VVEGDDEMKVLAFISAFLLICLLGYGGWHLKRWWNWEFEYRQNVEQTIRDMVKEECLIETN
jgi:hypothetical protein